VILLIIQKVINPDIVEYPSVLGGNNTGYLHGCAICQFFFNKGWSDEPQDIYSILSSTSNKTEFNQLCLNSTHCAPIIEKFLNGTYKAKYDGGNGADDIYVWNNGDAIVAVEGKHRICIAKRFKIKEIPVIFDE